MTLKDRGAVVTGGGRGIGAAVARALAEAGASVVVSARTRAQLDRTVLDLRERGGRAFAAPCDVTKPAHVKALARAAAHHLGTVDILVNCAGIASSAPVHALKLSEWERLMAVNATGTMLCTQAFLPGMMDRKWGRVVNIASVAGRTGAAYIAAYAASKHAVLGFTRSAAVEVAPHGVTVNAVCPGYVDTELTEQTVARIMLKTGLPRARAREALIATSPQRRLIEPEEVAYLVVCLCDPRARGVNGQSIVLDGGGLLA